jgi:hypothetical protein
MKIDLCRLTVSCKTEEPQMLAFWRANQKNKKSNGHKERESHADSCPARHDCSMRCLMVVGSYSYGTVSPIQAFSTTHSIKATEHGNGFGQKDVLYKLNKIHKQ